MLLKATRKMVIVDILHQGLYRSAFFIYNMKNGTILSASTQIPLRCWHIWHNCWRHVSSCVLEGQPHNITLLHFFLGFSLWKEMYPCCCLHKIFSQYNIIDSYLRSFINKLCTNYNVEIKLEKNDCMDTIYEDFAGLFLKMAIEIHYILFPS